ncbi:glycosyltransferase [Pelagibacteraceae bacterium]|nr:glycosyltransferase [Pelagibacteraceae bacterium]
MRTQIVIFSRYYLPGFKAGGPIESISTFVKLLHNQYQFSIFTSDRDFQDTSKYKEIKSNSWNENHNSKVFYLGKSIFNFFFYLKFILNLEKYKIIYFSSLFDFKFTIIPLIFLKFFYSNKKIILAPRGELYPGALSIKKRKKYIFLNVLKKINLLSNVVWHATSNQEIQTIRDIYKFSNIMLAPNIVEPKIIICPKNKSSEELKLVFFSRITPKKNLLYLIKLISSIKILASLDIYGPVDDLKYWNLCLSTIRELKIEKKVKYMGPLDKKNIHNTLAKYDLFVFPTLGENFGHVIFDAIKSGLPILISNKTPWNDIEDYRIGWSIPISEKAKYLEIINNFDNWWSKNSSNFDERCLNFINNNSQIDKVILMYKSLFAT